MSDDLTNSFDLGHIRAYMARMAENDEEIHSNMRRLPSFEKPADQVGFEPVGVHDQSFQHHRISNSTSASSESSPTLTDSTIDDLSATETSPGSSPESPPSAHYSYSILRPHTADASAVHFFELQKQPPPKKGRNLKNLAVDTSRTPGRAISTLMPVAQSPPVRDIAGVMSPGFLKPLSPPPRRPSNLSLTLLTPANMKATPNESRLNMPPPTPSLARPGMLRHFQSSPSLPQFPALGIAPKSRPRDLPLRMNLRLSPIASTFAAAKVSNIRDGDEDQNFDIPLSREEKPEAYPDGPICVYDPYVDLYAEPTAEQCREYDVIFNVASEVRNPFQNLKQELVEPDVRIDGGGGIQYIPKRLLAGDHKDSKSDDEASPTTPKATPSATEPSNATAARAPRPEPEYIHIPWEHNTDIVPDLLRLVKVMDDFVLGRKRLLVHCQCGVSRSASLVVAYGLYKNPSQTVQEVYDHVKKKSKWIGPNMNLIMQLQEFRTALTHGGILHGDRGMSPLTPGSALSVWNRSTEDDSSEVDDSIAPGPGPSSAPIRDHWALGDKLIPASRGLPNSGADGNVLPDQPMFASALSSTVVDTAGHIVHPVNISLDRRNLSERNTLSSAKKALEAPSKLGNATRAVGLTTTSLQSPRDGHGRPEFNIMSPTSTTFSPFDRNSLLASLGMGSVHDAGTSRTRASSLRSQSRPPSLTDEESKGTGLVPAHTGRLRGKLSSPNLREQQHLQNLQARIESQLHIQQQDLHVGVPHSSHASEALLSPRATEFTKNPFALDAGLLSPTVTAPESSGTQHAVLDPRSPAQPGASPIIRNIMDVL